VRLHDEFDLLHLPVYMSNIRALHACFCHGLIKYMSVLLSICLVRKSGVRKKIVFKKKLML